jgi:hypothetical protein
VNNRRLAALGALAAASLALAACTTTTTPATTTTTSPPPAPADQLTAALGKLKGASYNLHIKISNGLANGTGAVNGATSSATVTESGAVNGVNISIAEAVVGSSEWVKLDLGAANNAQAGIDPTKWMLVDQSKLTIDQGKAFDFAGPDALDLTGLLTSVSDVTRTDATHLAGKVDLTKATGVSKATASQLADAGSDANAVPFTAIVDDQGRLTDLAVSPPAAKDSALAAEYTLSDFGAATTVNAPAASDVVPAVPAVYQILNNA